MIAHLVALLRFLLQLIPAIIPQLSRYIEHDLKKRQILYERD
jgi:hypothetical protein